MNVVEIIEDKINKFNKQLIENNLKEYKIITFDVTGTVEVGILKKEHYFAAAGSIIYIFSLHGFKEITFAQVVKIIKQNL